FQVCQLPRTRRTRLATRGGQAFRDAVITQRALLGRLGFRIDEAAPVGAGLHAIPATEAVFLVHQNHAIRADEGGAHRTNLGARRFDAVVTQLGHEEVFPTLVFRRRKSLLAAIGRIHVGVLNVVIGNVVALDPGAKVAVRHLILGLAGADTISAAD